LDDAHFGQNEVRPFSRRGHAALNINVLVASNRLASAWGKGDSYGAEAACELDELHGQQENGKKFKIRFEHAS
jgi:hypothetical protein